MALATVTLQTRMKIIVGDKHSSLFIRSVSDEEKKFNDKDKREAMVRMLIEKVTTGSSYQDC